MSQLGRLHIRARNVGGIDAGDVELSPGVHVFFGANASNRSSLLAAVAGVLGARPPTLKTDATEGSVVATVGHEEYRLELQRRGDSVVVDRTPYVDDEALCDSFLRLLEDNPLRDRVGQLSESELYDLLMEPVDAAEIESEIRAVKRRRSEIEATLSEYDDLTAEMTDLQRERHRLQSELEEVTTTLEGVRADLDEIDERPAVDEGDRELLNRLESVRSDHRSVVDSLETHRRARDRSESELEEVTAEAAELSAERPGEGRVADVETELDRLRARKRELDETIQTLQTVVEVNRQTPGELLAGRNAEHRGPDSDDSGHRSLDSDDSEHRGPDSDNTEHGSPAFGDTQSRDSAHSHAGGLPSGDSPTAALDPSTQTVECWTCGTTVERSAIESRTDELQSIVAETREERDSVAAEIERLDDRREEWREQERRLERLREREQQLRDEIDDHEAAIESLDDERAALAAEIEELEDRVEETNPEEEDSEVVELYQRANELAYERGQIERQLDDIDARVAEIEETVADRESLVEERSELDDRLQSLQDRIYQIERETVDTINETMDDVLDQLAFENVERVWIERRVVDTASAGRADGFTLHVVRTTADGEAYEDTVDTLSTSEREVIGIVLAVAGYLVHDVAETVPVLLVDAIESLDAARIRSLLSYLADHTEYLLATAHPEDREAFADTFACHDIEAALDDAAPAAATDGSDDDHDDDATGDDTANSVTDDDTAGDTDSEETPLPPAGD
jgi:DNA repair ATPase RecN